MPKRMPVDAEDDRQHEEGHCSEEIAVRHVYNPGFQMHVGQHQSASHREKWTSLVLLLQPVDEQGNEADHQKEDRSAIGTRQALSSGVK